MSGHCTDKSCACHRPMAALRYRTPDPWPLGYLHDQDVDHILAHYQMMTVAGGCLFPHLPPPSLFTLFSSSPALFVLSCLPGLSCLLSGLLGLSGLSGSLRPSCLSCSSCSSYFSCSSCFSCSSRLSCLSCLYCFSSFFFFATPCSRQVLVSIP